MSSAPATNAAWGTYPPEGRNCILHRLVRAGISRGPVRRTIQKLWRHTDSRPFDIAYHGLKLRLSPKGNVTDSKLLLRSGLRDACYLNPLLRHAGPGSVFADIGANIGYYGAYVLRHGYERLIAIEPSPVLLPRLRFHIEANGFSQRAHIAPVAVADQPGQLFLHNPGEHGGASVASEARSSQDVLVPVKTLAQVVADAGDPQVRAFKIDIEGHEDRALLPWLRTLPDDRLPKCGVIETCHSRLWKEDLMAYLLSRGYRVLLQDDGNTVVERA